MEVKKATTFEQQVNLLRKRGLVIENQQSCETFLHAVNYCKFTAYLLPFRTSDDRYKEGTSFAAVSRIYEFDRKLRNLLFSTIEEIEIYLRTQFAYYHAHKYGALGYMNSDNFNQNHKHENFLMLVDDAINKHRFSEVVKHHRAKYENQFPIWVLVEFFSMGMLSRFYSDMLLEDKKYIAKRIFKTSYSCLDSWLRCLTDLRNRCAHYARLYYWQFTAIPKMPKSYHAIYKNSRRLLNQILVLKFLYADKIRWDATVVPHLQALIEEYRDCIDLSHIGFAEDWEDTLQNISIAIHETNPNPSPLKYSDYKFE